MTEQITPLPAKLARRAIRENQAENAAHSTSTLDLYRQQTMGNGAGDWVIEELSVEDLRIPSSVRGELGPLWLELEKLYQQCVDINNEYVGQTFHDALILLTDNHQVRQLHAGFYQVADQIWHRWRKKVIRPGVIRSFHRYLNCAIEPLERLRIVKHSLIPHLTDYTELLSYRVVHEHFVDTFAVEAKGRPWELEMGLKQTASVISSRRVGDELECLHKMVELYMVREAYVFNFAFERLYDGTELPAEAAQVVQEALDDIIAMRCRLFGQANSEKLIIEILPGQWLMFGLSPCSTLLTVFIDESREALLASMKKLRYMVPFRVDFDGQPIFMEGEWSTADRLGISEELVRRFQYIALPKIRDRLLEQYSHLPPMEAPKVDDQPLVEASLQEIELAVDYWSHRQQPEPTLPQVAEQKVTYGDGRLPQLRKSTVIARLEKLGVEVGRAKGSELKFFKPGGRVFVMGDHGGNDRLPSHLLAKLVKRLGLTSREVKQLIIG